MLAKRVQNGPYPGKAHVGVLLLGLLALLVSGCGGGGGGDGGGADPVPGTLQFEMAAYSGDEDAGAITITVTRTGGSDGAVSVDLSDAGTGSATSVADYAVITPATLSWADGDMAARTIDVVPVADGAAEPDETVDLALANVTGGASLGTAAATVSILNDDIATSPGSLQFSSATYAAAEADGMVTISVIRTGGDIGAVSVDVSDAGGGSATSGSDYVAIGTVTLSWGAGESGTRSFDVTIDNDTEVETPETVNLALGNESGGVSLGLGTATLTISSEDAYGVLQFSAAGYAVDETDGVVSNVVTLQRVGGSSGAVQVNVIDAGTGSAVAGAAADYEFTSPTIVSWADGDATDKNVTITIVDDATNDGPLTIDLSLAAYGGGATAGAITASTITINDDEVPSPGVLQFSSSSYSVAEDGGSATITVTRTGGDAGAVGVSYATANDTADAGSDYTTASGTLSWADGDVAAKTFMVPIINDGDVETLESVTLTLSSPTGGAALGGLSAASLDIEIDDTNLTMSIGDGSFWVAFQDGPGGTWQQWTPSSGNVYDFPVTDASLRYGVAFHRTETSGGLVAEKVYVVHATVTELPSFTNFENAKYTISGQLSNYPNGGDEAGVFMFLNSDGDTADPYNYSMDNIPVGLRDFIAYEGVPVGGGLPQNVVIRRDVNVSADATIDVDFTNDLDVEAFTFNSNTFASGTGTGRLLEVYYSTPNGTSFNLAEGVYNTPVAVDYPYITNTGAVDAGAGYSFQVTSAGGNRYRIRNRSAGSDPGIMDIGLGSLTNMTGAVVDTVETTGLSYSPNPTSFNNSPVFRGFQISLDQTNPGVNGGAHWQIKISKGWLNATGASSYTHPDFSSVTGFGASWDMLTGTTTYATVTAVTSTTGVGATLSWIFRKTMGNSSRNTDPDGLVYAKKLAHKNTARVDFASQSSSFAW